MSEVQGGAASEVGAKHSIEIYADDARGVYVAYYERDDPAAPADRRRDLPHEFGMTISEVAEQLQAELPAYEVHAMICVECGGGCWMGGSAGFVNRIPVCDDVRTNVECGRPYPWGAYICGGCDGRFWEELAADGDACAVHQTMLEGGSCEECQA